MKGSRAATQTNIVALCWSFKGAFSSGDWLRVTTKLRHCRGRKRRPAKITFWKGKKISASQTGSCSLATEAKAWNADTPGCVANKQRTLPRTAHTGTSLATQQKAKAWPGARCVWVCACVTGGFADDVVTRRRCEWATEWMWGLAHMARARTQKKQPPAPRARIHTALIKIPAARARAHAPCGRSPSTPAKPMRQSCSELVWLLLMLPTQEKKASCIVTAAIYRVKTKQAGLMFESVQQTVSFGAN